MKSWILFTLGTIYYFIHRYALRSKKTVAFSWKYWINDNWPEMTSVLILDLVAMIVLMDSSVTVDLAKWVPEGLVLPAKLVLPFLIGAGMGKVFYELFKKKLSNDKKD